MQKIIARALLAALLLVSLGGTAHAFLTSGTNITCVNGSCSISGQVAVGNGGTGVATIPAHTVVIGNGASAVNNTSAGTTGRALLSGGASADPDFGALDISTSAVTGTLAHGNGGIDITSVTDDTTIVASGSAWVAKALPSCTGAGKAVTYDTSTNAFGCNTIAGGSNPLIAFMSDMDIAPNTAAIYLGAGNGLSTVEGDVQLPSPGATFKNLRCTNTAIQGAGANHDIVITGRVGACGSQADATLTCTITGSASGNQSCTPDTTNTLAPTAGQCIDLKVVTQSAVANSARVSCSVERTA